MPAGARNEMKDRVEDADHKSRFVARKLYPVVR